MAPPIHIPGITDTADWIIFGGGLVLALYWLRALRLARQGTRLFLSNLIKGALVYLVALVGLTALKVNLNPQQIHVLSGAIGLVFFVKFQSRKRSRYIRKSTKEAVIKRHLEKTGELYYPQKHHIDHRWPHARGGSNTSDNLRVIEKTKNLKKGAKRPGLRDMW